MEKIGYVLGRDVRVHFASVGGDLRLNGQEGELGEIQVPQRGGLSVKRRGDDLEIACPSGCLAFMPATAQVVVDHVGGDVRLTGLKAALVLGTVGGDLSLRRDAGVQVDWVGGNLDLGGVTGPASVKICGGDARVVHLNGNLAIDQLGGDMVLRDVQGNVDVHLGGSARMALSGRADDQVSVRAGSDVACSLPREANVRLELSAGGHLRLSGFLESESEARALNLQLGNGEGLIHLQVGGDLWVEADETGYGRDRADLAGLVAARVQSKMAGLEAKLRAKAEHVAEFDAERIEEQVRRAVSRSLERGDWPEKRAGARNLARSWPAPLGSQDEDRRAQERLRILRMLEEKKISIEEAELLMDALEGEG
jgi:hypothetical protein